MKKLTAVALALALVYGGSSASSDEKKTSKEVIADYPTNPSPAPALTPCVMDTVIKYVLPIGAFGISLLSIAISIKNLSFSRQFAAAKKKTEFLSRLLVVTAQLQETKRRLDFIVELSRAGRFDAPDGVQEQVDAICQQVDNFYRDISDSTISDAVRIESAIAQADRLVFSGKRVADALEPIYARAKKVDAVAEKI